MTSEPSKDLPGALWDIEDILAICPFGSGGHVWCQLVKHCKNGTIDQKYVDPVEHEIRKYIAGLREADKRKIWSETETGLMSAGNTDDWDIQGIEMDLENELLAEVLDNAFRQAGERNKHRKSRKKTTWPDLSNEYDE